MVRKSLESVVFALVAFLVSPLRAESLESASPRTIDFGNGLRAEVLAEGSGEECRKGDRLTVHSTGWVERSEKRISDPFDDSRSRGEPLTFVLGGGEAIKGWDVGLAGMKVGEKRLLHVPPAFGYGSQDLGVIPPNSTLRFEVELLSREAGLAQDSLFDPKKIKWTQNTPGVEVFDEKTGLGDEAKDGDELTVHYTGWLPGGTRFATSKLQGKPVSVVLGAGQTIPGWEKGLVGMRRGGVRLMRIQPYMGYGAMTGPKIPPHSTLLFRVELLDHKGATPSDAFDLFPAVDSVAWTDGPRGLRYAVADSGSGEAAAKAGDEVAVHYTGWLADGTRFDTSRSRGEPFAFALGAGHVIPGWDLGVAGMKVGEKRLLRIPPQLGYGAQGAGSIPPNAELVFAVELVEIRQK